MVPTTASDDDDLPPLPHVKPLSDADRDLFLAILDNPPPPNAALRKLMRPDDAPGEIYR